MAVSTTSLNTTPVIATFEKRQTAYAPVEASEPILEVIAATAADALKERSSGGDSFDSLLCATLKALKGKNPTTFTSLLQSCTSLIDSNSHGRKRSLKERSVLNDKSNVPADVEAVNEKFGNALANKIRGRSKIDLLKRRALDIDNTVNERKSEGFNNLYTPL